MASEIKSDHDMIIEIHAVLLGANGSPGLCANYEKHKDDDKKFREDYYNFKRWVIIIASFIAGSGLLGFGIKELVMHLA